MVVDSCSLHGMLGDSCYFHMSSKTARLANSGAERGFPCCMLCWRKRREARGERRDGGIGDEGVTRSLATQNSKEIVIVICNDRFTAA